MKLKRSIIHCADAHASHHPLEALQSSCLTVMKMSSKCGIAHYAGRCRPCTPMKKK